MVGMTERKLGCIINGRQGVPGLWVVKTGGGGFGTGAEKGVGNRTGQREKMARDCAISLLRIVGLCPGVVRRRNYEITKIELSGARNYFGGGAMKPRHITLSLIGRFEQVEGDHQQFLPVAAVKGSGL
jgi:hypothetical protein